MHDEPFGMALAKLISGDRIIFVPNSRRQVEIVGDDERLTNTARQNAMAKNLRANREPDYQAIMGSYDAPHRDLFVAERFASRIRRVVDDVLHERPVAGADRVESR
jgi:hypothetical protein